MIIKQRKLFSLLSMAVFTFSELAVGATIDVFSCKLNVENLESSESIGFEQEVTTVRENMDYPRIKNHNVHVRSSSIPIKVNFQSKHQSKNIAIEIMLQHRFASDIGAVGRPVEASFWSCARTVLTQGSESFASECEGENDRPNPFDDPDGRWQSTRIYRDLPMVPDGYLEEISLGGFGIQTSLSCTHKLTRR